MTSEGLLTGDRRSIRKPGALPPVTVVEVVAIDADGELIAEPVVWDEGEGTKPRILVSTTQAASASRQRRTSPDRPPGVGDRLLARIAPVEADDPFGVRFEAHTIKRLPRDQRRLLGIFREHGSGGGHIDPIDRKALKSWPVHKGDESKASDGDLVRFEMTRKGRAGLPQARVLETLGNPHDQRQTSLIAVHAHGIPEAFPETVLADLDELSQLDESGRTDLRNLPLLTIDPPDARDHDDAVHACPAPEADAPGGWLVTVAIADVAYYVRPGTRLDREALKRGNSVYFPDRVVPMLPEKISNDLCSLRENEERPCLAVRMLFDKSGTKIRHTFYRGLMRSRAKLSYVEAQAAFDGDPGPAAAALWEPALKPLYEAYNALAHARDKRGPLNLDLPERKIVLDETGAVERVVVPERLQAHRLIEEFMIQANVAAAETLEKKRSPLVYRTHDQPSRERLRSLNEFLESLGLKLPRDGTLRPDAFNRILEHARELPVSDLVNEVILRAQAQAEYAPENYGHFGLNLRRYAHFTSPIRRYADLLVHRALIRALKLGDDGLTDAERDDLVGISEHISDTERRAMAAERETVDRLISAHLADQTGAEFTARISGVTRSGLFVRLADTGADGFIPASTLGDDFYHYVEDQHALVGDRSGLAYRLGDRVDVRLVEAIPTAGALRFEMLTKGRRNHVSLQKGWRSKTSRPHGRQRPARGRRV
jgi:ribonuclease R